MNRRDFLSGCSSTLLAGSQLSGNLLRSNGAGAAAPEADSTQQTPYLTNKGIFSLERLPRSMVVLGAGPIAAEMAQAFCRLGTRVSVVQRSGQILSNEDEDLADMVMKVLQEEGVAFYLNSKVLGVNDLGGEREIRIQAGDGQTVSLRAETLLVAMGREANLAGLNLDGIGVSFETKGLELDARLRTTVKHIYGAGDVTGAHQFTHAAGYEGGIVVSNAVFRLPRKTDYTFLPWCTYTDPELASIGMNEKRAKAAGISYRVWEEAFRDNDRSLAEGEHVGKIKMILGDRGRPLGVQILGPRAGDLISEWVAAFNEKVSVAALASSVHPYPTLGEINKKVAGTYLSSKIFSDTVRKGLRFFFHLRGRACGPAGDPLEDGPDSGHGEEKDIHTG